MKDTSTIAKLRQIFHWFYPLGFPREVPTNNCYQFAGEGFKTKFSEWGVTLVLLPPYHPQSNGPAEKVVGVVKNLLRKNQSLSIEELIFGYRTIQLEMWKNTCKTFTFSSITWSVTNSKNQPCL
ncbi:unnamed protein product [Lepeophtheirus salmonis]|uniref:(salmon louse) hypothetical protein n=1 Tax=Lepeophtheirus salmonis TaxID=72036 RepID=A0A7R8D358_LEPSM|nr:unnamed protein product [Lepeophtheirus salmonis]CAF2962125.1 unnamed protein product [Lepeophtheirus salmonis]